MSTIESIIASITIENMIISIFSFTVVFLLYAYVNGFFRKDARQDFIIKVKRDCTRLLEFPFMMKLILLLSLFVMVILMFAGFEKQSIGAVLFMITIPLLVIYLIVGNRNSIVVNIITICIALFIVYLILSISIPFLDKF